MKKTTFFFVLLCLVACASYDEYFQEYGSNYHNETLVDYWVQILDDPAIILDAIIMIDPNPDTIEMNGETYIITHGDENDIERWNQYKKFSSDFSKNCQPGEIYKKTVNIIEDSSYRNYIIWSTFEDMTFSFLMFAATPSHSVQPIPQVIVCGISDIAPEYKVMFNLSIMENNVKIVPGNKYFGYTHIKTKHNPDYYVANGITPEANTTLFVDGSDTYIQGVMKDFAKNCQQTYSFNENKVYQAIINTPYLGNRKYTMIVDQENIMVSFFPYGKLDGEKIFALKKNPITRKNCRNFLYLRKKEACKTYSIY